MKDEQAEGKTKQTFKWILEQAKVKPMTDIIIINRQGTFLLSIDGTSKKLGD